jgi:hypothetical protein
VLKTMLPIAPHAAPVVPLMRNPTRAQNAQRISASGLILMASPDTRYSRT